MLIPKFMKQIDSRWAKKPYATKGEHSTIGGSGCGPTSCANLVGALIDSSITPVDACKWFVDNGWKAKGQGTYYDGISAFLKKYKIPFERNWYRHGASKPDLKKCLANGGWAIVLVHAPSHWTRGGHFMLAYGIDGSYVLISDPNSTRADKAKNKYFLLEESVTQAWLIPDPEKLVTGKGSIKDDGAGQFKMYVDSPEDGYMNLRKKPYGDIKGVKNKLNHGTPVIVGPVVNDHCQVYKFYKGNDEWYSFKEPTFINCHGLSKYKLTEKYYIANEDVAILDGYSSKAKRIGFIEKGASIKSSKQKGAYAYIPKQKGVNISGWVRFEKGDKTYLKTLKGKE